MSTLSRLHRTVLLTIGTLLASFLTDTPAVAATFTSCTQGNSYLLSGPPSYPNSIIFFNIPCTNFTDSGGSYTFSISKLVVTTLNTQPPQGRIFPNVTATCSRYTFLADGRLQALDCTYTGI